MVTTETEHLTIKTDAYNILPPLSEQEVEALKQSIDLDGVRDPIVIDEDGNLLDGHHRHAIDPDAPRRTISGLTHYEKMAFAFQANMTRRNLSLDQKKELHRRMKEVAKGLREEDPQKHTQEVVAAMLGVARNTVSDWFRSPTSNVGADTTCTKPAVPPPDARVKVAPKHRALMLDLVESGVPQAQVAANYGVSQQQVSTITRTERVKRDEAAARADAPQPVSADDIHAQDFRKDTGDIVADGTVDLIFTDPPYAEVSLYGDLAKYADRVLRPGGWCLAYCGMAHLPTVLANMSEHLTYGWLFAIYHTGGDLRFRKFRLQSKWKPVLGFFKPPLSVWWEWFPDMVTGGREKDDHPWQQSLDEASHFINAMTPEGGLVCDPFAGSGTTCLAAKRATRKWVAFEEDAATAATARQRLHDEG
jgi:site-specific DNA-methyltransferase (adenine-specific)